MPPYYEKTTIFATSDNTETMHYTITDHQGSLAAYTGNAKEPVTRLSYDAWGRRRNAEDGSYGNVPAQATDRGYTGHEHLDEFGLINMNGRMYDPMLGRMLSPDIVVQQTDYTQSYNRYSYCFNNPLRFTDPTGWVSGDFYWKGKCIGSDGIDDGKVYLLRDGIDPELSYRQLKEARKFIKKNSGNTEAFAKNSVAYDTSIAIEGSESVRKQMLDIVSQDDGSGGSPQDKPENNREYGGYITKDGEVIQVSPGPLGTLTTENASAEITMPNESDGCSTFHGHPSGTVQYSQRSERGLSTRTKGYSQSPSGWKKCGKWGDIDNAIPGTVNYVFGRGNGMVYVYTDKGVQAVFNANNFDFVTLKAKMP